MKISTTVVLAISADGKLADRSRSSARFGSAADKAHLEQQVAQADAVLFGAATLRAYGTTLRVTQPALLHQRQQQGKPPQPVQIVCSRSAVFDRNLPFFRQPVPHWLLTTATGLQDDAGFDRVLRVAAVDDAIDWEQAFQQFADLGIQQLIVLGGGELVASLLAVGAIDELWLTVCPVLLGGVQSPTPIAGAGFLEAVAPRLELLEARSHHHEVFLHYRVKHD